MLLLVVIWSSLRALCYSFFLFFVVEWFCYCAYACLLIIFIHFFIILVMVLWLPTHVGICPNKNGLDLEKNKFRRMDAFNESTLNSWVTEQRAWTLIGSRHCVMFAEIQRVHCVLLVHCCLTAIKPKINIARSYFLDTLGLFLVLPKKGNSKGHNLGAGPSLWNIHRTNSPSLNYSYQLWVCILKYICYKWFDICDVCSDVLLKHELVVPDWRIAV